MSGFVSYGLASVLLLISPIRLWLPGSEIGFILFTASDILIDPEQHYDYTIFDFLWMNLGFSNMISAEQFSENVIVSEYLQLAIGFILTIIIWTILALVVRSVAIQVYKRGHIFDRIKSKIKKFGD